MTYDGQRHLYLRACRLAHVWQAKMCRYRHIATYSPKYEACNVEVLLVKDCDIYTIFQARDLQGWNAFNKNWLSLKGGLPLMVGLFAFVNLLLYVTTFSVLIIPLKGVIRRRQYTPYGVFRRRKDIPLSSNVILHREL